MLAETASQHQVFRNKRYALIRPGLGFPLWVILWSTVTYMEMTQINIICFSIPDHNVVFVNDFSHWAVSQPVAVPNDCTSAALQAAKQARRTFNAPHITFHCYNSSPAFTECSSMQWWKHLWYMLCSISRSIVLGLRRQLGAGIAVTKQCNSLKNDARVSFRLLRANTCPPGF